MARARSLLTIRNAARALADQANTAFVTDAQANVMINQSLNDLWEKITTADPSRYVTESTVAATTGVKTYALPADFYKLRYLDKVSGTDRYTVHPYLVSEKNRYRLGIARDIPFYSLIGQNLTFEPDPGTATYKLGYLQLFTELASDADTFDGVAGWEDYTIWDVAGRMAVKEESDPSPFWAERARIERRIEAVAHDRDFSRAPTIADTRSSRLERWPLLY